MILNVECAQLARSLNVKGYIQVGRTEIMKMLKAITVLCGLALCLLYPLATTHAQGLGSVVGSASDAQDRFTFQRQMLGSMILGDMIRDDIASSRRDAKQRAAQQAQTARGKQAIATGRATTQVQALQTMSVPQEFAAQVKMTPEVAQRFTSTIKQAEAAYNKEVKQKYGLQGNDLATATAALIDVCRQVGAGAEELTPKQFASLQSQLRERLLKAEYLQGMSASERRKGYEGIMMAIGLTAIGVQEAQQANDAEQMKQAREFANQTMKTLTSFDAMQVKTNGEQVILPQAK